jgi:hypothetical protein
MRIGRVGVLAAVLGCSAVWAGGARAQSLLGNAQPDQSGASPSAAAPNAAAPGAAAPGAAAPSSPVVIPPAPSIMASPPTQLPAVVPESQPPGLVETPVPPAGNADTGQAGTDGQAAPAASAQAAPAAGEAAAGQAAAGQAAAGQPAGGQAAGAPAPDTASSVPPPIPDSWVPEHTAELGILDKVDGGANTITVPVGGQTTAGDLQISVLACVARPPDEVPDDAVFVAIQPTGAGDAAQGPLFRGWMVRSIPGATVVGDASETLRVVGCS